MSQIFASPLTKWPSLVEGDLPAAHGQMKQHIIELHECGVNAVNIPTHEYLEYLGPQPKALRIRELSDDLITTVESFGMEATISGFSLTKHHGKDQAQRGGLKIIHANRQDLPLDIKAQTSTREQLLPALLTDRLRDLPIGTLASITIAAQGQGGTFYLNHSQHAGIRPHITKFPIPGNGQFVRVPYPALNGILPATALYVGGIGDTLSIPRIRINDIDPTEINERHEFVGNKASSFAQYRMIKYDAISAQYANNFALKGRAQGRHVMCPGDEINTPFGHELFFAENYPGGWPEWLGKYIENAAYCMYYAHNEVKPFIWMTDPRSNPEELRFNRFCAPVPVGKTCDYLNYINGDTPMRLVVWADGANAQVWNNLMSQTAGFDVVLGIYAGRQNILQIANGVGIERFRELDKVIFYWKPEQQYALATIAQVQELCAA